MTRPAENRPATPLVGIATCDLGGIVRGRFVPTQALDAAMATGIGWLPANLALTPFNGIADNLFGSRGDLRILPDPDARFIADTGGATPFDLLLGDVVELDGQPWSNCPRGLLKRAVAALHERTGWHCIASFEQEFQLLDRDLPPVHALSLAAVRQVDPFASQLVGALEQAGIQPETVLAEFGRDQFEITCAPAPALQATDRAIAIREIAREIARRDGGRASFAPKTDPSGVGNGVHIHLSLRDASGAPVGYDPARPGCLSRGAGAFFAGIVRHLPALTALTASSPISYLRLRPNSWSAAYTWLGERDREASLRICPVTTLGGRDPARQYNVEYRPADATANPYLALAAILYAGLAGIAADLEPAIFAGDPSRLSEEERAALGLARLPETLEAALAALKSDTVLGGWLPLELVACFAAVKRVELDRVAAMDAAGACALYAGLY